MNVRKIIGAVLVTFALSSPATVFADSRGVGAEIEPVGVRDAGSEINAAPAVEEPDYSAMDPLLRMGAKHAFEASERVKRCGNVHVGDLPVRGGCK